MLGRQLCVAGPLYIGTATVQLWPKAVITGCMSPWTPRAGIPMRGRWPPCAHVGCDPSMVLAPCDQRSSSIPSSMPWECIVLYIARACNKEHWLDSASMPDKSIEVHCCCSRCSRHVRCLPDPDIDLLRPTALDCVQCAHRRGHLQQPRDEAGAQAHAHRAAHGLHSEDDSCWQCVRCGIMDEIQMRLSGWYLIGD